MVYERFGKIVFIARDNFSEGFLIRETGEGLVLENYLDSKHINIDVVAEFEKANFGVGADFENLFTQARKYVPDLKVPIHVDLNKATVCT
ncbi:MAG: hypothetical protein IJE68_05105 [Clostridia bacterium]|nr:hypothetical protein [Clostridia bacterium]